MNTLRYQTTQKPPIDFRMLGQNSASCTRRAYKNISFLFTMQTEQSGQLDW